MTPLIQRNNLATFFVHNFNYFLCVVSNLPPFFVLAEAITKLNKLKQKTWATDVVLLVRSLVQ